MRGGAGLAALAVLLASGCLDIRTTTYPVPVCLNVYPDGTPKDCGADQAVAADAAAAAGLGWTCMGVRQGDGGGWALRYELWLADGGEWRARVAGHGTGEADAVVATVTLHDAASRAVASRIVETRGDGWVSLGTAAGGVASWTVLTHAFRIESPSVPVEVRATAWAGTTWFVHGAPDGSWAMDGSDRPRAGAPHAPVDLSFAVDGLVVTVDHDALLGGSGAVGRLAPLPGLGLPCDAPG